MAEKVCDIDVHKNLLVATILDPQTQEKQTMRFRNSLDNIDQLQNWLKQNNYQTTTMESTSIYWIPLYEALETAKIQVTLANAYQIKAIPRQKTDQTDSEWLTHLLQTGLIKPSYVPSKTLRDLRELTHLRTKCVQTRTQNKNRCQKVLNRVNIRLRTVLSNIFGKAGTELVEGLMQDKTVKTILKDTKNKQLQALSEEIKAVAQGTLSVNDVFVLQQLTTAIKNINEQVKQIDKRIAVLTDKCVMEILCSVPGVGVVAGATISAELGDPTRFSNCKQVASWCGFAPSVYQSAGATTLGHITKD